MTTISSLTPTELGHILHCLPVTDLSVCTHVCSIWRDISFELFTSSEEDVNLFVSKLKEYVVLGLTTFMQEGCEPDLMKLKALHELFDSELSMRERSLRIFPKVDQLARLLGKLAVFTWLGYKKNIFESFKVDLLGGYDQLVPPHMFGMAMGNPAQDDNMSWLSSIQQYVARKQSEMYFQMGASILDNRTTLVNKFEEFCDGLVKIQTDRQRSKGQRTYLQEFAHVVNIQAYLCFEVMLIDRSLSTHCFGSLISAISSDQCKAHLLMMKKFPAKDFIANSDFANLCDAIAKNKSLKKLSLEDYRVLNSATLLRSIASHKTLEVLHLIDCVAAPQTHLSPVHVPFQHPNSRGAKKSAGVDSYFNDVDSISDIEFPESLQELVLSAAVSTGLSFSDDSEDEEVDNFGEGMAAKEMLPISSLLVNNQTLKRLHLVGLPLSNDLATYLSRTKVLELLELDCHVSLNKITWNQFCSLLGTNTSIQTMILNFGMQRLTTPSALSDPSAPVFGMVKVAVDYPQEPSSADVINLLSSEISIVQLFSALKSLKQLAHLKFVLPYDTTLSNLCTPLCNYLLSQLEDQSNLTEISLILSSISARMLALGQIPASIFFKNMDSLEINALKMVITSVMYILSNREESNDKVDLHLYGEDKKSSDIVWSVPAGNSLQKSVKKFNLQGMISEELLEEIRAYMENNSSFPSSLSSLYIQTNNIYPNDKKFANILAGGFPVYQQSLQAVPANGFDSVWSTISDIIKVCHVHTISLSGSNLNDKALVKFASATRTNKSLKVLQFCFTDITVNGILAAVLFLSRNKTAFNLQSLDLVPLEKSEFNYGEQQDVPYRGVATPSIPAANLIPILKDIYKSSGDDADEDDTAPPPTLQQFGMFGAPATQNPIIKKKDRITWGPISFEEAEEWREALIARNKMSSESIFHTTNRTVDRTILQVADKLREGDFDLQAVADIVKLSLSSD